MMHPKHRNMILRLVVNKQCEVCGQPSCCAMMNGGAQPMCDIHGAQAEKMGYEVIWKEQNYGSTHDSHIR